MKGTKIGLLKMRTLRARIFTTFLLSLTVVCINTVTAQAQPGCSVKNFNTDNGLSQNSIIDMTMDSDGYLWLAAQSNLTRYDGKQFRVFPFSNNQPGKANDIRYILTTSADRKTIIGSADGKSYTLEKGIPVWQRAWQRTPYAEVVRGSFLSASSYIHFNKALRDHHAAYEWGSNTIYVITLSETDFIAGYENTPVIFYYKNGIYQTSIMIPGKLQSLMQISGHPFIEDEHSGLYLFDKETINVHKVNMDWASLKAKPDQYTGLAFYPDPYSGHTWAFLNGTCYSLQLDAAKNILQAAPQFTIKDKDHFWRGITYDSSFATFFISTLTEGLFQVKPYAMQTFTINDRLPKGLDPGFVIPYTVLKTSDTTALLPTGVQFVTTHSGDIAIKKQGNILGNRETLAQLADGRILSPFNKEMNTYSASDGFTVKKPFSPSFRQLNNTQVGFVYPEGDSVWVSSNDGIYTVTPQTVHRIYKYEENNPVNYALLKLFHRLNDKEIFVSNPYTSFILHSDPPYTRKEIPALKNKQVRYISRYKDMFLLSVIHEGLYLWKNGQFLPVPVSPAQPGIRSCHSTYIDSKGYIWVTTNKGLYKSTAESVVQAAIKKTAPPFFIYYGKDDGIANIEFNGAGNPSYAVLKNEQLFYPSMGGIVTFLPGTVNEKIPAQPLFIEKIFIDTTEIELTSGTVTLPPGPQFLTVDFSTPFYGDVQNLLLEYSLDSSNWKKVAPGQKHIILSAIPDGTHRFLFRKKTGFGSSDYVYAAPLIIKKKKSIFSQWWFYALLLLLVLLLYYLVIKIQLRSAERKRKLLQQKVDEQTQELSRSVETKDLLISIIMHDMITPLRHISLISAILKKGLEKDPEKATQALADIQTTSERIMANSNSIINWIKYSNKHIPVQKDWVSLRDIADEAMELYLPIAAGKKINLINEIPPTQLAETDPTILNTILVNIIANAVKNTDTGEIRISSALATGESKATIKITDTGGGMKKETYWLVQETLRGNLQALKTTTKINTGLGYIIIAELVKLGTAQVQVQSSEGSGTTVTVSIN